MVHTDPSVRALNVRPEPLTVDELRVKSDFLTVFIPTFKSEFLKKTDIVQKLEVTIKLQFLAIITNNYDLAMAINFTFFRT